MLDNGRGAVGKTPAKIEEILALRHDLPTKFSARDADNRKTLQGFVDALFSAESDDDSSGGFDSDETKAPAAAPAPKPAPKAAEAPEAMNEGTVETKDSTATAGTPHEDEELANLLNSLKSD